MQRQNDGCGLTDLFVQSQIHNTIAYMTLLMYVRIYRTLALPTITSEEASGGHGRVVNMSVPKIQNLM